MISQPLPISRLRKTGNLRQNRCVTLLHSKSSTAQYDARVTSLPLFFPVDDTTKPVNFQ